MKSQAAVALWVGAASLWMSAQSGAQVKAISSEGLPGLTKEDVEFEPEYRDRSARQAGVATPAKPGTPPGSTNPRNIAGNWINSKTFPVDAPAPAAPNSGRTRPQAGSQTFDGVVGVGLRTNGQPECRPRSPFTLGYPAHIIQTPEVIYVIRNSMDGSGYRRIEMSGKHPANVGQSVSGHSIGHWEGDTLVIETVALKGAMAAGESFGMEGAGKSYTPASKVTERWRKTDNHMQLENMITIEDPQLDKPYRARIVNFWRPDLKFVEAPCEEYSDPLDTELDGPFKGGDEPRPARVNY
jgi:hypothetical protein